MVIRFVHAIDIARNWRYEPESYAKHIQKFNKKKNARDYKKGIVRPNSVIKISKLTQSLQKLLLQYQTRSIQAACNTFEYLPKYKLCTNYKKKKYKKAVNLYGEDLDNVSKDLKFNCSESIAFGEIKSLKSSYFGHANTTWKRVSRKILDDHDKPDKPDISPYNTSAQKDNSFIKVQKSPKRNNDLPKKKRLRKQNTNNTNNNNNNTNNSLNDNISGICLSDSELMEDTTSVIIAMHDEKNNNTIEEIGKGSEVNDIDLNDTDSNDIDLNIQDKGMKENVNDNGLNIEDKKMEENNNNNNNNIEDNDKSLHSNSMFYICFEFV